MHRSLTVAIALAALALSSPIVFADPGTTPGKTGEMLLKFTERSPLSSLKLMAPRLSEKKLAPDYNLAEQEFLVWVADDYAPSKPQGLFLLLNYKESASLPEPILPMLRERRLIFITPREANQDTFVRVGLALDAVHNLKKYYAIDDTRIYLFDFDRSNASKEAPRRASAGQLLSLCYSDVISATFTDNLIVYWRPMRNAQGQTYQPMAIAPPAVQLGLAKTHPMICCFPRDSDEEFRKLNDRAVQQELRLLKRIDIDREQVHYPTYKTEWLVDALKYFEEHAPKPKAAPLTRPAASAGAAPKPVPAPTKTAK